MTVGPVRVGQYVISCAGRDTGREYLVSRLLDGKFLMVVDGDERPVSRPKKKNRQHLELCQDVAAALARKLESGESVTDAEVRGAILAWKKEREGGNN